MVCIFFVNKSSSKKMEGMGNQEMRVKTGEIQCRTSQWKDRSSFNQKKWKESKLTVHVHALIFQRKKLKIKSIQLNSTGSKSTYTY